MDRAGDNLLLRRGQFRVKRQRKYLAGGKLGFGEIAFFVTEVRKAGLQVQRGG